MTSIPGTKSNMCCWMPVRRSSRCGTSSSRAMTSRGACPALRKPWQDLALSTSRSVAASGLSKGATNCPRVQPRLAARRVVPPPPRSTVPCSIRQTGRGPEKDTRPARNQLEFQQTTHGAQWVNYCLEPQEAPDQLHEQGLLSRLHISLHMRGGKGGG